MTTRKRNTKIQSVEAVAGDRDLMKALLKEALQEVLEGEMTEFLGVSPVNGRQAGTVTGLATMAATWSRASASSNCGYCGTGAESFRRRC
jgi:hypothetical protein